MIDIHTHILPQIDDGSKNVETSLKMLEAERAQGVKEVVLTSHYYGRKRSPQQFLEMRDAAYARIAQQIPDGLKIRLGAEVHFTGLNLPSYEALCSLAIEGTESILFEFPFTEKWDSRLMDALADFIYETDYMPIVAHIERYQEVLKNPSLITQLINMGCLIQVNARSFIDKRTRNLAFALLKRDMVHCIASDAHDTETRTTDLLSAKIAIEQAGLSAAWARVQSITTEILSGKKLCFKTEAKVKKFFGMYF